MLYDKIFKPQTSDSNSATTNKITASGATIYKPQTQIENQSSQITREMLLREAKQEKDDLAKEYSQWRAETEKQTAEPAMQEDDAQKDYDLRMQAVSRLTESEQDTINTPDVQIKSDTDETSGLSDILPAEKPEAQRIAGEEAKQAANAFEGIVYEPSIEGSGNLQPYQTKEGYRFRPQSANDLTGQCAWYAEQLTTLSDGSNWTIGSKISEKKSQFENHRQNGNAYLVGEDVPEPGQSVVFNGGQWGHVAVIAEIKDGKARLNECNYGNDCTVSESRWVDLDDPTIIGFLRTKPRGINA